MSRVNLLNSQKSLVSKTGSRKGSIPRLQEPFLDLAELLPFAWLRDSGAGKSAIFENWNTLNPNAEPLVGVTSSSERLADLCSSAPPHTKVIVVNGLRMLSNLQAFDEIASSQRLVLFGDHDDEDAMRDLENRGCRFWIFGEREFFDLSGLRGELEEKRGVFAAVVHRASNFAHLRIRSEHCESELLSSIAIKLEEFRPEVNLEAETNPNGKLGRLAQRLWRILNEAAGLCREPSSVECDRFAKELSALRSELNSGTFWLKPETVMKLRSVLESFKTLFEPGTKLGVSKGITLCRSIEAGKQASASPLAVVARTEIQARSIADWLRSNGVELPVFSLATIPDDAAFDQLIVVSWPGSDAFRRLIAKLITPDIVSVSYDFEARWLRQCRSRFTQRQALTEISAKEKTAFVSGGNAHIVWPEDAEREPVPAPMPDGSSNFDVWSYEQRLKSIRKGGRNDVLDGTPVRAKYVSFFGDAYAFLTQWHKLPVATHLLGTKAPPSKSLPERTVDDLKLGDLVVFPEGGQKTVIAQMADRLIGPDAPALRKCSRLWREALLSSNKSPEQFLKAANILGHTRHIATIRNWFYDEAQIGPAEREDLNLIATVTDSAKLKIAADKVWETITFLRARHLGAGSVLRDAVLQQIHDVLPTIEETGSLIEVPNLGTAWIVQVDAIDQEFKDEARGRVDCLLWDHH